MNDLVNAAEAWNKYGKGDVKIVITGTINLMDNKNDRYNVILARQCKKREAPPTAVAMTVRSPYKYKKVNGYRRCFDVDVIFCSQHREFKYYSSFGYESYLSVSEYVFLPFGMLPCMSFLMCLGLKKKVFL
jgi:hypothetical protein